MLGDLKQASLVVRGALCASLILAIAGSAAAQRRAILRDEAVVRDALIRWNRIAIDASGLDHTAPAPGETRGSGEQLGPGRAARAMAIVHIAMFETINAVTPIAVSYTGLERVLRDVDLRAAIAQSAHDTLVRLFQFQASRFDQFLRDDLSAIPAGGARDDGVALGQRSAEAILAMRAGDGANHPEPRLGIDYVTSDAPGHWRQDPVSQLPVALGARWADVRSFVLESASQFRAPPPPAMTSDEYAEAFAEVRALGGDGVTTPTIRTADETHAGIYWAYDGMPSLCAPPRLYNQLLLAIADRMQSPALELARLLAVANVAMADAALAIWESKYYYDVWRPVTGIREADPGGGPTGSGDDNPRTEADTTFMPLGAPTSNLTGPGFSPPFPSYPSGHAGFGGAVFQTLRRLYRRDDIPFTFVSDEFNGETVDGTGQPRPLLPRHFTSLSQAEEENGQSRIYLGIHWSFDKTEGIAQGRRVADYVWDRLYTPLRSER